MKFEGCCFDNSRKINIKLPIKEKKFPYLPMDGLIAIIAYLHDFHITCLHDSPHGILTWFSALNTYMIFHIEYLHDSQCESTECPMLYTWWKEIHSFTSAVTSHIKKNMYGMLNVNNQNHWYHRNETAVTIWINLTHTQMYSKILLFFLYPFLFLWHNS